MNIINTYKAALITIFITGIVSFTIFSIELKKANDILAETFYEIETKTEEELLLEEQEETDESNAPKTNKAFNEDTEYKALMKNFKSVSFNDFEKTERQRTEQKNASAESSTTETNETNTANYSTDKTYALKQNETEAFKNLQGLLDKKSKKGIAEHASGKSSLTYSLKNRKLLNYNTPRYLCETSGKIVVNIKVNSNGKVFEASINNSSNSNDKCLQNHAISYAKSVTFNTSERTDQLGTITFYFKGK